MKKYALFISFLVMLCTQACANTPSNQHTHKSQKTKPTHDHVKDDPSDDDDDENDLSDDSDPLEPLNRTVFEFNRVIDGLFLKPAATLYDVSVNDTAKVGIRNALDNAFSPITAINHTLQGEGERAFRTVFRFLINTTIGCLGLVDAADGMGLKKETATLNETFATWGVKSGPYLILPIFGPSSFRDLYSRAGEFYMDPLYYVVRNRHRAHNRHKQQRYILMAAYGVDALDKRWQVHQGLKDIEKMSDPYVAIRSIFFQKQNAIVRKIAARKAERK